jgi:hypothetical protein
MTTVVYTTGGGRLGNQLLNYANLLGFALEHPDCTVVDLAFARYADLYGAEPLELVNVDRIEWTPVRVAADLLWRRNPYDDQFGRFPLDWARAEAIHAIAAAGSDTQSIIGGDAHVTPSLTGEHREAFSLDDPGNVDRIRSRDGIALAGWGVRGWPLVADHRDEIRARLRPGPEYVEPAKSHVQQLRDEFDTLVGVLVRQDDYREWCGGKYFYSSPQYRERLDAFADWFGERDVGYLIASDERQTPGPFGPDRFRFATGEAVGPNHYLESFVELSMCDIVVTPPSTFSVFAAFLGDVPIVPLHGGPAADGWERLTSPLLDSVSHPMMSNAVQ